MTTQLKQDLIAAREFLATHEWGQGLHRIVSDSYCAVEALCEVTDVTTDASDASIARIVAARRALTDALGLAAFTSGGLVKWNDQEGRTKDEVLAAFDKAIEVTP